MEESDLLLQATDHDYEDEPRWGKTDWYSYVSVPNVNQNCLIDQILQSKVIWNMFNYICDMRAHQADQGENICAIQLL